MLIVLLKKRIWNRDESDLFDYSEMTLQMQKLQPKLSAVMQRLSPEELETTIDLRRFIIRLPRVHEDSYAAPVYNFFRANGMRHMPVVNTHSNVVGIITRKDILPPVLIDQLAKRNQRKITPEVQQDRWKTLESSLQPNDKMSMVRFEDDLTERK